jgi:hypothetical protein
MSEFQEFSDAPLDQETALSFPNSMFRVVEFVAKVKDAFHINGHNALVNSLAQRGGIPSNPKDWFDQGIDCEILKPDAKGWKKGKIRIQVSVEFCPEQPEELVETSDSADSKSNSSLDDIRQMINE